MSLFCGAGVRMWMPLLLLLLLRRDDWRQWTQVASVMDLPQRAAAQTYPVREKTKSFQMKRNECFVQILRPPVRTIPWQLLLRLSTRARLLQWSLPTNQETFQTGFKCPGLRCLVHNQESVLFVWSHFRQSLCNQMREMHNSCGTHREIHRVEDNNSMDLPLVPGKAAPRCRWLVSRKLNPRVCWNITGKARSETRFDCTRQEHLENLPITL